MKLAKKDTIPISAIREKRMDAIFDWFEQHQQWFYTLGWFYLRNQQQMEELFYKSILKVHQELPRFKGDLSFETWIRSIFIHICRELSNDKSVQVSEKVEPRQGLFKALAQLNRDEKEALILTYVHKTPKEEAAFLLQVSEEKLKELLFSGIQSLRNDIQGGSTFNGCKEYHKDYINYLERTMERPRKIDFEIHIYHCPDCQEDLGTFQEVMLDLSKRTEELHMPSGFMEKVKDRLAEKENLRQQKHKKRKRTGLVFTSVIALLLGIGYFTGVFTNVYYSWTEEDHELRSFLQQGLGERLNLVDESDGVRIKIKSVISDDVQTLVFYEIEDTEEDNQYVLNYQDGVSVKNEHEIMNRETYQRYVPPDLETELNKKENNVFHGKISLLPLREDNGTIKLQITKLQKLIPESSDHQDDFRPYGNTQYETGEWNFEIPVTKHDSIQYALDKRSEVEGIPIRYDKLIIAPTATILQYSISNERPGKMIDVLTFDNVEVNDRIVKADQYGSSFLHSQYDMNWTAFQAHFAPLFGVKPKEINVQLQTAQLRFEDQKSIELDASQEYPQTFEYAGSTISIDKVEVGMPSEVVISNHDIENRAFQSLHFDIVGENENEPRSMEMHTEGLLVDKNGVAYDMNKKPIPYEEIELPRYYVTVERVLIYNHESQENEVVPKGLNIYGYTSLHYVDDVVKISVE